jgi:hypothetical protein
MTPNKTPRGRANFGTKGNFGKEPSDDRFQISKPRACSFRQKYSLNMHFDISFLAPLTYICNKREPTEQL